jgi:hypothetical protein
MNRRTILKSLVAAQTAAILPAQTPPKERTVDETPKVDLSVADANAEPVARFFTKDQFAALTRLCDLLEPPNGKLPGAREAHAPEFLDFLISVSPADRQNLYRTGLDRLNAHRPFATVDDAQVATLLEPLKRPWTYEDPADQLENFLRAAKTDIMEATRNSYEYISVASRGSRRAGGVGEFWYPIY